MNFYGTSDQVLIFSALKVESDISGEIPFQELKMMGKSGFACARMASLEVDSLPPETLRPQRGQLRNQPLAVLIEIDQRKSR